VRCVFPALLAVFFNLKFTFAFGVHVDLITFSYVILSFTCLADHANQFSRAFFCHKLLKRYSNTKTFGMATSFGVFGVASKV